jgi:stage IV sporulation protein FB
MLSEPADKPYDLRFSLFGTRVRVHPLFWLFSIILGWNLLDLHEGVNRFIGLGVWVACCFLSILLHEFGHVWAGRAFGNHGSIVLYSLGGLAIGASDLFDRWKRVVVYLAGPMIELVLFAVIFAVAPVRSLEGLWVHYSLTHDWFTFACILLWEINLYWALLNLVPVWPLDGGKVSREFFTWINPRNGVRASLIISIVTAGLLAVNAFVAHQKGEGFLPYVPTGGMWMALFYAILAVESWMALQALQRQPSWETDERLPWESDPDAWKRR